MKRTNPPDYHLFIGGFYPKDQDGNPLSVNMVWHDLQGEGNPNIVSKDIISAALYSRRNLTLHDNLIKLRNLCHHWASPSARIIHLDDLFFTTEQLAEARKTSGIDPDFFAQRKVISARHREALALCKLIGEGGESPEWTDVLRKAASKIAEKDIHTSATAFLRIHRYRWEASQSQYTVPNVKLTNSIIARNSGREIDWVKEVEA